MDRNVNEGSDVEAETSIFLAEEKGHALPNSEFQELREMVQDLQVGFTAAMTELSNIQDEDKKLYDKLNDSKQEQEVQMKDILQLVQALKEQCDNIQQQVDLSNKNQQRMERQIKKLKGEKRVSKEKNGLTNMAGFPHQQSAMRQNGAYTSPMLKSFIASLPLPEDMEDVADHHSDSDESLAEVTQKSLLLTNSLAQRAYEESPHLTGEHSNSSSERDSKSSHTRDYPQHMPFIEQRENTCIDFQSSRLQVQRQKTAVSILDSERNYCTTLYNLIENHRNVLRRSDTLSARDCSRIFPSSLTVIYEYHCAVLSQLEMRLTRWRQQDILGDIFAKFTDTTKQNVLSEYKEYIENFPAALRTVRKLNKSSERFQEALINCQKEMEGDNMSLISQLLAPVRRIPSLVLYIKKLLKYTDSHHPDRFFLESSLNSFRLSLSSVNEALEHSIQQALSDSGSSKKSLETSSWSSHEEEQRLSTATKDSGINSNCDLDSHDELSPLQYRERDRNSSLKKSFVNTHTIGHSSNHRDQPQRPKSMVDFMKSDNDLTSSIHRRSKTPTADFYNQQTPPLYQEKTTLKPSLSHSTPNLLDDPSYEVGGTGSLRQPKTKHKVQFKNPPEEQRYHHHNGAKRMKKRSITETLRIIFNRRKTGQSKNSNSDVSDSCYDLNSSMDDGPTYPHQSSLKPSESELYIDADTYEDENGDPYSVV
ncbi:rho guanine nucleotide exchange factor 33-like isoform X2 [Watersipora subatra]|uniref:rho guanine nucleotide exchange factor 33-like isoform X2 n=1 Tax=Watersipora subatra TaxID=2589382 RepID=UPI00355C1C63